MSDEYPIIRARVRHHQNEEWSTLAHWTADHLTLEEAARWLEEYVVEVNRVCGDPATYEDPDRDYQIVIEVTREQTFTQSGEVVRVLRGGDAVEPS